MAWGRAQAADRRGLSGPTEEEEEERWEGKGDSERLEVVKKTALLKSDHVLGIYGINRVNIFPLIEDSGTGDIFLLRVTVLHATNSIQWMKTPS